MITILFEVIVPAFLVIGVGAALGRAFRLELAPLNRIALYAAVPSLVFGSMSRSEAGIGDVALLLAGNATFLLAMAGIAVAASLVVPRSSRRGLIVTSLFGNSANIMLPVALYAFGEPGLQRALILYVFSTILMFTFAPMVLGSGAGGDRRRLLGSVARLPVVWAALAAILVSVSGTVLPVGLVRGIDLLADAAIPLVLLTLGLQIQRTGARTPSRTNIVGATLKLVVAPAVGFVAAWAVGARGLDLSVLTLLAAMPPAVNTFMLALEFDAGADEVAGTVILATLASLGSLAGVVWILRAWLT